MSNDYPIPDEFDAIGKVLILDSKTNLTLTRIKELVRATKVRKLKSTELSVDGVITLAVTQAYKCSNAMTSLRFNLHIYQVIGVDVTSNFLSLADEGFICANEISGSAIFSLIHANEFYDLMQYQKNRLNVLEISHLEAVNFFENEIKQRLGWSKTKFNTLETKTALLDKLQDGYGDDEIAFCNSFYKEFFTSTW
jgi:D-arabinose 1-dehydrogenase-like Zn-dependent alcohol dehydrogenase